MSRGTRLSRFLPLYTSSGGQKEIKEKKKDGGKSHCLKNCGSCGTK
jgi:hypothetical protein